MGGFVMFSQTFVGSEPSHKWPAILASASVQILAMGCLTLVPLFYIQGVGGAQLKALLFAPSRPPSAPVVKQAVGIQPSSTARVFRPQFNEAIRFITRHVEQLPLAPAPEVAEESSSRGAGSDAALFGIELSKPLQAAPAQPVEKPAAQPARAVKVGGVVAEANLIRRIQPLYPPLAKAARVSGIVRFAAVISKEGRIENLQLLSGHPLLVQTSREAILQWQYRPTLLNGQPVEVITEIAVQFTLAQ
jgi:protein TonB